MDLLRLIMESSKPPTWIIPAHTVAWEFKRGGALSRFAYLKPY